LLVNVNLPHHSRDDFGDRALDVRGQVLAKGFHIIRLDRPDGDLPRQVQAQHRTQLQSFREACIVRAAGIPGLPQVRGLERVDGPRLAALGHDRVNNDRALKPLHGFHQAQATRPELAGLNIGPGLKRSGKQVRDFDSHTVIGQHGVSDPDNHRRHIRPFSTTPALNAPPLLI
jgi:hypothetical protein